MSISSSVIRRALCFAAAGVFSVSLPGQGSSQNEPWNESLERQLASLWRDHGNKPLEIIVIHHGIYQRAEQTEEFADLLSRTTGYPVIALPSYGRVEDESVDRPWRDEWKALSQYMNRATKLRVDYVKSWERILKSRPNTTFKRIVFHSGAGINANTGERSEILDFVRKNPGSVEAVVFAMTDLKESTRVGLEQVGVRVSHIDDVIGRLTRPAAEYVDPSGDRNPIGMKWMLGWLLQKPRGIAGANFNIHSLAVFDEQTGKRVVRPELLKALDLPKRDPARTRPPIRESVPAAASVPLEDPGGIDLTSMELRYLTEFDMTDGHVAAAAFRGDGPGFDPALRVRVGCAAGWDAFFAFLALPNSSFWVNLNPSEPDRIIDSEFRKTRAGQVMLEADFELKVDLGRLTHPRTPLGREFWRRIEAVLEPDELPVSQPVTRDPLSFRVWVVPGDTLVWVSGTSIYVLEARMMVKLESEYLNEIGARSSAREGAGERIDKAEGLLKSMILPQLIEDVNSSPRYAELRQVFYSRVVAEHYKRTLTRGGAFSPVIGSDSVEPWQANEPWSAEEIFGRYRESVKDGEYSVQESSDRRVGNQIIRTTRTYFLGGVDFTKVKSTVVSAQEVARRRPMFGREIIEAVLTPFGHRKMDEIWAGSIAVGPRR